MRRRGSWTRWTGRTSNSTSSTALSPRPPAASVRWPASSLRSSGPSCSCWPLRYRQSPVCSGDCREAPRDKVRAAPAVRDWARSCRLSPHYRALRPAAVVEPLLASKPSTLQKKNLDYVSLQSKPLRLFECTAIRTSSCHSRGAVDLAFPHITAPSERPPVQSAASFPLFLLVLCIYM